MVIQICTIERYWAEVHDDCGRVRSNARDVDVALCVWLELLSIGYSKHKVLMNKRLPLEVVSILAADPDVSVREEVAMKRAAAPLADLLSRDNSERVRRALAQNRKTPINILRELAHDASPWVAQAANEMIQLRTKSK